MPPAVTGDSADVDQKKRIEGELVAVLMRYRETTEVGILVCALVRCARALLNRYSGSMKSRLRQTCVDFLNDRRLPSEDPASKLFAFH